MSATILLVDDELPIRDAIRTALQACGYIVLDAATYDDALRTCRQHGGPIALLITDLALPGNNGYELAAQVAAAYPDSKVIFTSGQAGTELCKFYNMAETDPKLLKKPFQIDDLLPKVKSALGAQCSKKCQANGI